VSGKPGASRRAAAGSATASSPAVVARRHRYERRLRSRVKREQACLGSLPATTRRLLGLRAGLSGAPRTRSEAAAELGISTPSAARLERTGLRELHVACGGAVATGGGGRSGAVNARFVSLANDAPALQPAAYLPVSGAPDLQKPSQGQGDVKGATATVAPQAAATTKTAAAAIDESHGFVWALLVAAGLGALGALALVTTRRRAGAAPQHEPVVFIPPAPAPQAPAPVVERSQPEAPAPVRPAPVIAAQPATNSKIVRSASVVASAAASFAVRELVRRRRRR
jgi:hypothetical protein